MTTQVKICGVCNKNEVALNCEVCGIPLCTMCRKRVRIYEGTLAAHVKPGIVLSPLRAGIQTKNVCAKCMVETDFYEGEYY